MMTTVKIQIESAIKYEDCLLAVQETRCGQSCRNEDCSKEVLLIEVRKIII
jgi:hypothetical protein